MSRTLIRLGLVAACIGFLVVATACGAKSSNRADAALIRSQLAAAKVRKAALLRQERRILDTIPRFPGARLVGEDQNPEDGPNAPKPTPRQEQLDLHASSILGARDYLDWSAYDWGTFRSFSLRPGAPAAAVYDFLTGHLPHGWIPSDSEGVPTPYRVDFKRGRLCPWFLIFGTARPTTTRYEVAVDRSGNEPSC